MKKSFLTVLAIAIFAFTNAQNSGQTAMGKWLIEANTGFGTGDLLAGHSANTGFSFISLDGQDVWSAGAEGGYFVIDDLALKVGLGYSSFNYDDEFIDDFNVFSYKLGAKYYIISTIPVQVDIAGASIKDTDENPLWLGIQGGYAWFLGENVSIEPGLRYNLSLNENFYDTGILEFRIGFALYF